MLQDSKFRIAFLTIIIGAVLLGVFKLLYPLVPVADVVLVITILSFLLACLLNILLKKLMPGGKGNEKD